MDFHRQKSLVRLESELELAAAYLEIEQLRYKDRLIVNWDVDEGVEAMIPPLTLQPLIENSIRHGMSDNSTINVTLQIKKTHDKSVSIVIEDNGPGIDPDKQQELLMGNSERCGFTNVMARINMISGSSFTLESKPGYGTRISIIVPEETPHESDSD